MSVLSRDGRAREIRLQQDDDVIQALALAREYGAERVFGGGRAHASTGDTLSFSAWAETLFEAIAEQNLVNHDSMAALRQLIEQDQAR